MHCRGRVTARAVPLLGACTYSSLHRTVCLHKVRPPTPQGEILGLAAAQASVGVGASPYTSRRSASMATPPPIRPVSSIAGFTVYIMPSDHTLGLFPSHSRWFVMVGDTDKHNKARPPALSATTERGGGQLGAGRSAMPVPDYYDYKIISRCSLQLTPHHTHTHHHLAQWHNKQAARCTTRS